MAGIFEYVDNICRYVSEKTDDLAQRIGEEMALQKIQSQIREDERGISRIFQKIGECVYEDMKAETVTDVKLKQLFTAVGIKKASIKEYKRRAAKIKNMDMCGNCGEFVENSAVYCPCCGNKIERCGTEAMPETDLGSVDPGPQEMQGAD